jgi:GNAT superfamily N-acetyltransferase
MAWELAMSSASQTYVCAIVANRVIGFGSLSWKNNLWQNGLLAHVDELVVHSQHRGRGVGARILGHLTDVARAKGCKRLELDSAAPTRCRRCARVRSGTDLMREIGDAPMTRTQNTVIRNARFERRFSRRQAPQLA